MMTNELEKRIDLYWNSMPGTVKLMRERVDKLDDAVEEILLKYIKPEVEK